MEGREEKEGEEAREIEVKREGKGVEERGRKGRGGPSGFAPPPLWKNLLVATPLITHQRDYD